MSGSRKENAYVNFDLHNKFSFLNFFCWFFCKYILKCLAQNRMRADFSFSDNFGQKMWLKEGYAEKKMFSYDISRSIKVIWVYYFFCIPIGYHVVKNDENVKMSYNDTPTYVLNLAIWAHLAPQCISNSCSMGSHFKEKLFQPPLL